MNKQYEAAEIYRAITLMVNPGDVVELRVPKAHKAKVISGYYDDVMAMTRAAADLSGAVESVYLTLNPVKPALLARADNRCKPFAENTTSDEQVLRRQWMLYDFDPIRPAGISSTDDEHEAALTKAREVRGWMIERGWPQPILADSGNGAHLLARIDLPNDAISTTVLSGGLETLSFFFDDDVVEVDVTTFNPSRLVKLYGTLCCKGDSVPRLKRVHRLSRMLEVPERLRPVSLQHLQQLADDSPKGGSW